MRDWTERFRQMRARGIKIPAAWGHQSRAQPIEPDDREQQLAQFNAGYLTDLRFTRDQELVGEFDIPGAEKDESGNVVTMAETPDGLKLKCAIGEVSASINDWTDGKKETWKDSIVHVALTPLPVWHGQDSFQPVSEPPATTETRLSLSLLFATGDAMPDEPKEEKPAEKPEGDETKAEAQEEKDAAADHAEETGGSNLMRAVSQQLMDCGIK